MILNILGGIVSGAWLLFTGEWAVLGYGLLYMFVGVFVISLALFPAILLAVPAAAIAERTEGVILPLIVSLPALVWTFVVMAVSCALGFSYLFKMGNGDFWPFAFWAYAVVLTPWSYMASKEERTGNDAANVPVFFAQLGTVSMIVAVWIDPGNADFWRLIWWFSPFAILGCLFQTLMAGAAVFRRVRST